MDRGQRLKWCALASPGGQLISLERLPVLLDGGHHLRVVPGVRGSRGAVTPPKPHPGTGGLHRGPERPGNGFLMHGHDTWNKPFRRKDDSTSTDVAVSWKHPDHGSRPGMMSTGETSTNMPITTTRHDDTDRLVDPDLLGTFASSVARHDPRGLINASGETAMVIGASARLIRSRPERSPINGARALLRASRRIRHRLDRNLKFSSILMSQHESPGVPADSGRIPRVPIPKNAEDFH